jgi:hypothetical protein
LSRKLILSLSALTVAGVMAFGPADALAAKNHAVTATGKAAVIGTESGRTVALGRFLSTTLGETVVVFKTKILKNGKLSSTLTAYTRNGTLRGTALQTVTPTATGGSTFSGTAKITGGTGLYGGATGTASATGTQAKDNPVISYRLKGNIRY